MNKNLMPTSEEIVKKTWRLLVNRPAHITLMKIAKDTGLSRGWISMFKQSRITNPSYETLAILHNYLINL